MPTIHRTRTLKRFDAVSILNPINRLTVTAFSLRDAACCCCHYPLGTGTGGPRMILTNNRRTNTPASDLDEVAREVQGGKA